MSGQKARRTGIAMLQSIGKYAERKSLGAFHSFFARRAVRQDARQLHPLGDPAAIVFTLDFDLKHLGTPQHSATHAKIRLLKHISAWLTRQIYGWVSVAGG